MRAKNTLRNISFAKNFHLNEQAKTKAISKKEIQGNRVFISQTSSKIYFMWFPRDVIPLTKDKLSVAPSFDETRILVSDDSATF